MTHATTDIDATQGEVLFSTVVDPADDTDEQSDSHPEPPSGTLDKIEKVTRIAAAVAVAGSALLATWQYYESGTTERRERSIRFLDTWQKGEERLAYSRLSRAVASVVSQNPLPAEMEGESLRLAQLGLGSMTLGQLADDTISYDGTWHEDVDLVVQFYSEMEYCITAKLCDVALLDSYFESSADGFWSYFQTFAEERRAQFFPQYGLAVENLIAIFGGHE